jgi:hypothetical protein
MERVKASRGVFVRITAKAGKGVIVIQVRGPLFGHLPLLDLR